MRSIEYISFATAVMCLAATSAGAFELSPNSPRARAAMEAAAAGPSPTAAPQPPPPSKIRIQYRASAQANAAAVAPDISASVAQNSDARVQNRIPDAAAGREDLVLDKQVNEQELRRIADSIAQNPAVEWAVPQTFDHPQQANDPLYGQQWHYNEAKVGIRLQPAWAQSTGKNVIVAVIDTGIREHADIKKQLLKGYDFVSSPTSSNDGDGRDADATDPGDWCPNNPPQYQVSSWHGLHVAGTIAAVTNNSIGGSGIGPDVKILPVRVLGQCGGSNFDIADAIRWAAGVRVDGIDNPTPARVINLSLGGMGPCDAAYAQAIREARQRGATVVVAAGNSDMDARDFRPANCDGVISVAATSRSGARAYFGRPNAGSNFGASVKIAAPGGETYATAANGVLSTMNDGVKAPGNDSYEAYQGTSMAAPHVAGVVALMYQVHPNMTPDEALSILQTTSQPFSRVPARQCTTSTCGAGIVDAEAAVLEAKRRASARAAIMDGNQKSVQQ